jgi:hypothetical protein
VRSGPRLAVRWTTLGVVVAGALALLGLVAMWPRGDAPDLGVQPNTYVDATVTAIKDGTCDDPEIGGPGKCLLVEAHLTSGDDSGDDITFQVRATQTEVPPIHDGDKVVLLDVATSLPNTATRSPTSNARRHSSGSWPPSSSLWWRSAAGRASGP